MHGSPDPASGPVWSAFSSSAHRAPSSEALVDRARGVRLTFDELRRRAEAAAGGLFQAGLRPGDRVGVWAQSGAPWVVLQLAVARLGAVLVGLSPAFRRDELAAALPRARPSMLLHERSLGGAQATALLASAGRAARDHVRTRVALGSRAWRALTRGEPAPPVQVERDATAMLLFTSGTTGRPRGVLLSHASVVRNAWCLGEALRLGPGDRICAPVPLFHAFGAVVSVLAAMVRGATLVVPAPRFDAAATLRAIAAERCTVLHGVPAMFVALLEHPERARARGGALRTGIMAGAPCPPDLVRRVSAELPCPGITVSYGQTETSPASTIAPVDAPLEVRATTVGAPLPGVEVRIVDPATGAPVPPGGAGEVCVRGHGTMQGYVDEPGETAAVLGADGWLRSGDLGRLRGDGLLEIVGRLDELVNRGGEKIAPVEVERVLASHPAVAEVCVTGVADAHLGEIVVAWVTPARGAAIGEDALREHCRGRIAGYKVPDRIRCVREIPHTPSGKPRRDRIRELEERSEAPRSGPGAAPG